MPLVNLPGIITIPDAARAPNGAGFVSLLLDATAEKAAGVFRVPRTGTIDRIRFRTAAVTTSDTLKVGLETVDASGDPTGAQYGGSAVGTQAGLAANTQYEVTLATPATAVRGNTVAAVIGFNAFVAGNLNIAAWTMANTLTAFPYADHFTAAWAKSNSLPMIGLRYSDGIYYDAYLAPYSTATIVALGVDTAGFDEYAMAFSLPFACRFVGAWGQFSAAAGGDAEITLYDGTTALITDAIDGDARASANQRTQYYLTASTYDLAANKLYRLSFRPTTVNTLGIITGSVNDVAGWGSHTLGANAYLSKRLDQGAWTDVTTERPFFGIMIDAIEAGPLRIPNIGRGGVG